MATNIQKQQIQNVNRLHGAASQTNHYAYVNVEQILNQSPQGLESET